MFADLEGKVVAVTAAGRGIGRATARALAEAGSKLVLADIDAAALAEDPPVTTAPPVSVTADVTTEAGAAAVVDAAVAAHGRLDVLVNVVGGSRPGRKVTELSLADWQADIDLNLTTVFLMARAALPVMEGQGGGVIVNVSSGAGLTGMQANAAYCAAKAAVVMLTRTLAIDHSAAGVRVNGIAPGPVLTPLMQRNRTPEEIAWIGRRSLAGRVARPDEMAAVIRFLASDESSYINGETIPVTGGVTPGI